MINIGFVGGRGHYKHHDFCAQDDVGGHRGRIDRQKSSTRPYRGSKTIALKLGYT